MDILFRAAVGGRYSAIQEDSGAGSKLCPRPSLAWEAYKQKGMYQQAVAELQRARALSGEDHVTAAALGHAYAMSGKRAEAIKALEELKELSERSYVPPYDFAVVYTGLGEKDKALEWLQKAVEDRSAYLVYLNVEPIWDRLRSDPRFNDLLRLMRLAL